MSRKPRRRRAPIARPRRAFVAVAFVALAALAYGPAVAAPFDFDDGPAITENPSIRRLWPLSGPWHTPALGTAVSGRPVVNVSFALNYALNRRLGIPQSPVTELARQTIGYHVVNILLHVLAGLLLWAVIRETLRFGRLPETWRDSSERIAIIVATIWLVHPIQAEAVDYVSQRTELLVSVCYLGMLYAAIRAWPEEQAANTDDPSTARHVVGWSVVAVVVSLLGMGSKEVMITAPVMVMLYDRAFLAADWRTMWRTPARMRLYVALLATSMWSVWLINRGARANTAGFDAGLPWYQYLYSQAWAISHYLKLLLWPDDLRFDYGRQPIHGTTGIPGFIGLALAGVATLLAWRRARWRWLGFLGAWFFLLLGPSSSIVPIRTEIAAERRVYLALAAVITLLVVGAEYVRRRARGPVGREHDAIAGAPGLDLQVPLAVGVVYVAACGWTVAHLAPENALARMGLRIAIGSAAGLLAWCLLFTTRRALRAAAVIAIGGISIASAAHRSALYGDLERRWQDAVEKTPSNGRAYDNLASAELRADPPRIAAADSVLRQAMAVDSMFVPAWVRSATIAMSQNRLADAQSLLEHALRLHPGDAAATNKLGQVLLAAKRPDLALPYLTQYALFAPNGESLTALGLAYLTTRQLDSAVTVLERAAHADSTRVDARRYLVAALVEQERGSEALPYAQQAARLDPTSGITLGLLSLAYAQAGQADAAAQAARVAVSMSPNNAIVYVFVGRALHTAGRFQDAAAYLTQAVRLTPNDPQALTRLGLTEAALGRTALARKLFERVLDGMPDYALARRALDQLPRSGTVR